MTQVHKGNLIELAVQTEMGLQVNFGTKLLYFFHLKMHFCTYTSSTAPSLPFTTSMDYTAKLKDTYCVYRI